MTGVEQLDDAYRRLLLVVLNADASDGADAMDAVADLAAHLLVAVRGAGLGDLTVEAHHSTGGYQPDPNRPQAFVPAVGAVQVDFRPEHEASLIPLVRGLDLPAPVGEVTVSAGYVVTCLERSAFSYLLLLGAQRKTDLTPEQFGRYWSQTHAPHATTDLRAAPVPIGYELFLVDHELTAAMAGPRCLPSAVDGWMHMTTPGPSDLAGIIRDAAHSAWVLEDEANFVDFAAPLIGQQMRTAPL